MQVWVCTVHLVGVCMMKLQFISSCNLQPYCKAYFDGFKHKYKCPLISQLKIINLIVAKELKCVRWKGKMAMAKALALNALKIIKWIMNKMHETSLHTVCAHQRKRRRVNQSKLYSIHDIRIWSCEIIRKAQTAWRHTIAYKISIQCERMARTSSVRCHLSDNDRQEWALKTCSLQKQRRTVNKTRSWKKMRERNKHENKIYMF